MAGRELRGNDRENSATHNARTGQLFVSSLSSEHESCRIPGSWSVREKCWTTFAFEHMLTLSGRFSSHARGIGNREQDYLIRPLHVTFVSFVTGR